MEAIKLICSTLKQTEFLSHLPQSNSRMEEKTQDLNTKRQKHPKENGNFLKHLFFCWELPIFVKGWSKELTEEDLYATPKEHDSALLGHKLEQLWSEEETSCKNPSLSRALIKQFGLEFFIVGVVFLPIRLAKFLRQPFFLEKLLDYYKPNQTEISSNQAYAYAGIITLLSALQILFYNWMLLEMAAFGMKMRIACSSLMYRKILQMRKSTIQKITVGQMINLLSNDTNRFNGAFTFVHFLWIAPIEIILGVWYMDIVLGHAAVAGVGLTTLCLLLQIFMSRQISLSRRQTAQRTDHRIRLINDVICGIQAIKIYTWERPFLKLVNTARNLELKQIKLSNYLRLGSNTCKFYLTQVSIFVGVLATILTQLSLSSQYIYSMRNIYDSLNLSVIILLPIAVTQFAEVKTSVRRIEEFLLQKPDNLPLANRTGSFVKESVGISITGASFRWDQSLTLDVLSGITFNAKSKEVIGVFGAFGSGKSTLLQAILNEIHPNGGNVSVEGTISYAPQDPWIFSASIRQNVLFGQEMDMDKYLKVIKCCALETDLSLFSNGDQELVGERGVMLSGGQKARLNLARAIYRDADVYLLDDPLSAVDAKVARQIFEECVLHYLKGKCVVLVTNQIQYLPNMNRIYLLEKGKIVECNKNENRHDLKFVAEGKNSTSKTLGTTDFTQYKLPPQVKEHRSKEISSVKLYKSYCTLGGHWFTTSTLILLFVLSQFVRNFIDSFLSFWINLEEEVTTQTSTFTIFFTRRNCLYIYAALLVALIVVTYVTNLSLVAFCKKASTSLHRSLLTNVMHQPLAFFNHHCSGRILNRFSNDIGFIDEMMPITVTNCISSFVTVAGTSILISFLNYWMILSSIIMLVIVYFFGVVFQPTHTNLRRTEAITKSSVFGLVTESIQGLTTIKAFNAQKILCEEFDNRQNVHTSAFYLVTALNSTLGFWADLVAVVYIGVVSFSFFFLASSTSSSCVGLTITQSLTLIALFPYLIKMWGELETYITSVERVADYIRLPLEPNGGRVPPNLWPKEGKIVFDSVSMQYSPTGPSVLKQVSFQIRAGEKIGIVGRTGAGKTSLVSTLFRLFDFDGTITIDDTDIKTIPLNSLRSKISLIPQNPVLFLGTLRKNLDPFDEFSDEQIWKVFGELNLKKFFENLPNGIDSTVSEGGSNFSVGQRQLLCLVRTTLRSNKIIVLDEATANVDLETDKVIQSTIRRMFQNCTVLTVAHRLNTVMDSDKILVMDDGCVAELGNPYQLLQNPNGLFYAFAEEYGKEFLQNCIKGAQSRTQK